MPSKELRKIYRTPVKESFPDTIKIHFGKGNHTFEKISWDMEADSKGLRYGSNPHQKAAFYQISTKQGSITRAKWLKWGKGGPSATNILDGYHGMRIVGYFDDPAVAIVKHLNPCGVGVAELGEPLSEIYSRAREVVSRAAFGSVVVFNRSVDSKTASEIVDAFVEVVYAPDYETGAMEEFSKKKDLRIAKIPKIKSTISKKGESPSILMIGDEGLIVEDQYSTAIRNLSHLKARRVATERKPTETEYKWLLRAWWTCCEAWSNAVVFWKDERAIAVGISPQDRIGGIEDAISRVDRFSEGKYDLKQSVMASDGFLPKIDNIDTAARSGVTAIVQPGGSAEDDNIIEACNKAGIAMVFTEERSFRHY